jgi:hypothetical protein
MFARNLRADALSATAHLLLVIVEYTPGSGLIGAHLTAAVKAFVTNKR